MEGEIDEADTNLENPSNPCSNEATSTAEHDYKIPHAKNEVSHAAAPCIPTPRLYSKIPVIFNPLGFHHPLSLDTKKNFLKK